MKKALALLTLVLFTAACAPDGAHHAHGSVAGMKCCHNGIHNGNMDDDKDCQQNFRDQPSRKNAKRTHPVQ